MLIALPNAVIAGLLQWGYPDASMSLFGEEGGILTETIVWSGLMSGVSGGQLEDLCSGM